MKGPVYLLSLLACLHLFYLAGAGVVTVTRGDQSLTDLNAVPVPCKTAPQWEGRYSEWNHNAGTNNRYTISFDGLGKRKWIEEERKSMIPGRRLFKFLVLFEQKITYKIDLTHNVCSEIPTEPWRNFSIPPTALFEDQYLIGGPEGNLDVTEWSDRQPARQRESWIGGFTQNGCWPIFDIFTFTNDTVSIAYTTRFFDLTPGIKNMSVFDVPDLCKKLDTQTTTEPPTAEPWGWGAVGRWFKKLLGLQKIDDGGVEPEVEYQTPKVNIPVYTEGVPMNKDYLKPKYWFTQKQR